PGGEEGLHRPERVTEVLRYQEGPAEPGGGRSGGEALHHAPCQDVPAGDELPIRVGVATPAGLGDARARRVEVPVEDQGRLVAARRGGREPPRVAVDVAQPVRGEGQLLRDAGEADHQVRRRAPVRQVTRVAFDRRGGPAHHRVLLDHVDVEPGAGEVGGADQSVVAGPDHHHVMSRGHSAPPDSGSGSGRPRTANGRESPSNRYARRTSVNPCDRYSRQAPFDSPSASGVESRTVPSSRTERNSRSNEVPRPCPWRRGDTCSSVSSTKSPGSSRPWSRRPRATCSYPHWPGDPR